MANNDPAYLFYPADFEMGTLGMTYEQKGKYITLMNLQFSKGGYLTERDLNKILDIENDDDLEVFNKFIRCDKGYYNERLLKEITKRRKYSESRRNNRLSKKDMSDISESYDDDMENKDINKDIDNNVNVIPYKQIIDYLNQISGKHYRSNTNETQKFIKARWNEGFNLNDFISCIDNAWAHWKDKPEGNTYMRPKTLFNGNFEDRVNGNAYGWTKTKAIENRGNKPKDIEVDWLEDYIKNLE